MKQGESIRKFLESPDRNQEALRRMRAKQKFLMFDSQGILVLSKDNWDSAQISFYAHRNGSNVTYHRRGLFGFFMSCRKEDLPLLALECIMKVWDVNKLNWEILKDEA